MGRSLIKWILIFIVVTACVDPIMVDAPGAAEILVVDGSITDAPGPYWVKISRGVSLEADSAVHTRVRNAIVKLYDDTGAVENFVEPRPGEYRTDGAIRGTIGRTYHITAQLPDGTILESEPEKIYPRGQITSIRHQFDARSDTRAYGVFAADAFNIFVDGDAPTANGEEAYVRWRMTGTYKVMTHPELHETLALEFYYKTPYPCSGYNVAPALHGGILEKVTECTCCTCWVKQFDAKPQLSDTELVSNGQFRNVKVGEVPISGATFYDKYKIDVEQMTISRSAFEFFKLIRLQKDAPSNLFQPPPGRLTGNIRSSKEEQVVVGLFWATSVTRTSTYLLKSDVPYIVPPIKKITEPCNTSFAKSTTTKPADWDE
ncbi:MAG TPA: DUF4249 domain-containing protein [Cyclobacteriaceae bacterium]|nr:DUF4249 domain-containing protein [Cyclobacteriaceae bacterium]